MLIIIAITLSLDAFSLALAYGTLGKNNNLLLSVIVGIYHFIMPLLGNMIGEELQIIVFIILLIIGIQMILESNKKENIDLTNYKQYFLFGFAVSVDSFSVGTCLNVITNKIYIGSILFSIFSAIFTYFGLILGNKINKHLGKKSTLYGGIFLIIISIIYLLKI